MGAKIVLSGEAQEIQRTDGIVTFTIHAGPATRHPPRGLELYNPTRYRISCTARQWARARQEPEDRSALLVEGYLEPRRDEETGALYVAVVATAVQSTLAHNRRRLEQLQEVMEEAREAFRLAKDAGVSSSEQAAKAAAFVKANEKLTHFLERHPELAPKEEPAPKAAPEGAD
jgi:hypothetical protein